LRAAGQGALELRVGLVGDLEASLLERRLDLGNQLGDFLADHLVIDEVAQRVQQVGVLFTLNLSEHYEILGRVIEALSTHRSHVVQARLLALLGSVQVLSDLLQLLLNLLLYLHILFVFTGDLLLLVPDLNQLHRSGLEVLLKLSHVAALPEQSLRGSSELVFQNLFALQVCTLGALHELVAVVFVADLEVVECVQQGLDFLLTLLDLAVQFVTVSLQLLLLLGGFDNIVGLRVLTLGFDFARARLVALDEALILDAQVLHLVVPLLQLDLDFVAFFLRRLQLANEDVFVHLDLFFTLLHGHLELVLAVLVAVDFIGTQIHLLAQALDLKLHDVVLHKGLLLVFDHSFQIATGHFVLEFQLADD